MEEDYYELLDVPQDASESEIKAAYRERIKESHPDVSDDREANERTKQLIEAKDVLTDETQRKQYDRVGHEQFVADTPASSESETNDTDHAGQRSQRASQRQQRTRQRQQRTNGRSEQTRNNRRSTTEKEHSTGSWNNSTSTDPTGGGRSGQRYETWGSDRSYVVDEAPGTFDLERLLDSQQTVVLLGTTFVIYPILLAGSLLPIFPTAANLTIGLCTILVITYLQSIPQVGILVFGIWSVLLPIGLFTISGLSLFSLTGILGMAAVLFPFGLSVLTWVAISPTRQA